MILCVLAFPILRPPNPTPKVPCLVQPSRLGVMVSTLIQRDIPIVSLSTCGRSIRYGAAGEPAGDGFVDAGFAGW